MNTVPGFTAEAALFRSGRPYGMSAPFVASELQTRIQMSRATGPYGPIGLPGQGCEAACTHICMMGLGGVFRDQCIDACRSTCRESSLSVFL